MTDYREHIEAFEDAQNDFLHPNVREAMIVAIELMRATMEAQKQGLRSAQGERSRADFWRGKADRAAAMVKLHSIEHAALTQAASEMLDALNACKAELAELRAAGTELRKVLQSRAVVLPFAVAQAFNAALHPATHTPVAVKQLADQCEFCGCYLTRTFDAGVKNVFCGGCGRSGTY